jgi:hypothetical protein
MGPILPMPRNAPGDAKKIYSDAFNDLATTVKNYRFSRQAHAPLDPGAGQAISASRSRLLIMAWLRM